MPCECGSKLRAKPFCFLFHHAEAVASEPAEDRYLRAVAHIRACVINWREKQLALRRQAARLSAFFTARYANELARRFLGRDLDGGIEGGGNRTKRHAD